MEKTGGAKKFLFTGNPEPLGLAPIRGKFQQYGELKDFSGCSTATQQVDRTFPLMTESDYNRFVCYGAFRYHPEDDIDEGLVG